MEEGDIMAIKGYDTKTGFIESLKAYDEMLASNNLGVFHEVTLSNRTETKLNIFLSVIGFIIGFFTGHGFYRTSEAETGSAVVVDDGIFFFVTENGVIHSHIFLAFNKMDKASTSRNIILVRQLVIKSRKDGYRLNILYHRDEVGKIDVIKEKLRGNNLKVGKRRLWVVFSVALAAVIAFIIYDMQATLEPADEWARFTPVYNSDTLLSPAGDYRITFADAYATRLGVGQRQQNVVMIYFDYEALKPHSASRVLTRNFVIYQNGVKLEFWDGGFPADSDRGFLTSHTFEAGEIYYARGAVVTPNPAESITIVRYNREGGVVFSREFPVRN
jgi:hypothetical protein